MAKTLQNTQNQFLTDTIDFLKNNCDKSSLFTLSCVALGSYIVVKIGNGAYQKLQLKSKRDRKRRECVKQIQDLESALTNVEHEKVVSISKLSTDELIAAMRNEDFTCEEVLHAFQCKALEAHKKTNCLVQPISEADDFAKKLTSSDKSKPLYGLPVSIKDNFGIKGYGCTIGSSTGIGHPYPDDSVLVKVLKHQGAVPFVKTNVPQGMLSWETTNPIYGNTTHPLDSKRGVGGSSGGEAAIIAAGGSVLGLGGDIGGSIRIPAALCGIVGLKPTSKRLSPVGTHPFGKGQNSCASSFGPMGKDVDSVVLAMRSLCVPKMWELDPKTPPVPFNEQVYRDQRRLTIGFYTGDGLVEITPAMKRGVLEAKTLLQQMGHSVVEWDLPKSLFREIVLLWPQLIFGDGGKEMLDFLKHDAVDSSSRQLQTLLGLPIVVKKTLAWILWPFMPNIAAMLAFTCGSSSVFDSWQKNRKQLKLTQAVINMWQAESFDVVIAPGFACPALPLGSAQHATGAVSCTSVYNVLDFTVGSLPVTTVTAQDEAAMKNYPAKDIWHYTVKKGSPDSRGLPVNVQVVCLPWQDELCLRVMKELESAVERKQQTVLS